MEIKPSDLFEQVHQDDLAKVLDSCWTSSAKTEVQGLLAEKKPGDELWRFVVGDPIEIFGIALVRKGVVVSTTITHCK